MKKKKQKNTNERKKKGKKEKVKSLLNVEMAINLTPFLLYINKVASQSWLSLLSNFQKKKKKSKKQKGKKVLTNCNSNNQTMGQKYGFKRLRIDEEPVHNCAFNSIKSVITNFHFRVVKVKDLFLKLSFLTKKQESRRKKNKITHLYSTKMVKHSGLA